MLLTVQQKLGEKEESQEDFDSKRATMKMLLETKFWRNITNYMEENKKTAMVDSFKWQGFINESINPCFYLANSISDSGATWMVRRLGQCKAL
jgi:hypothetical protein